jgi:hypothetical protein
MVGKKFEGNVRGLYESNIPALAWRSRGKKKKKTTGNLGQDTILQVYVSSATPTFLVLMVAVP